MTYRYLYQDRDNNNREGEIRAKNREEAYALLRKSGIKPYRVIGDDPWNWRPWAVAAGYFVLLVVIGFLGMKLAKRDARAALSPAEATEFRQRAEAAVLNAPEAYRFTVWKGINARLQERGLEPLPKPEGIDERLELGF